MDVERFGAVKRGTTPLTVVGEDLKVGDTAPDAVLTTTDWTDFRLIGDTRGSVRIIATVPSLDTGVCARETKRFEEERKKLPGVEMITVSMDLPWAQKRWCSTEDVSHRTLSAHRNEEFARAWGVLVKEMRILRRAVFVVDRSDRVVYAEYLPVLGEEPRYDAVIAAARAAG